ncbi:MAG: hypothetical protein WD075_10405 [Rhodospirillales bacterium]
MTIDALFILKALFSISIVVALSLIAERAGPRVAGLLTGLPLGAGIVIIFTGIEQNTVFAAEAARHMVPGFVTTVVFIYLYATVAARRGQGGFAAVLLPMLAANAGYAVAAYLVSLGMMPLWAAIPMVIASMLIGSKIMAGLPNTPIMARVSFGWRVLAFRAGMATSAILLITGIAGNIGPQWTGILTAYPMTLLPLILVIHITYTGNEIAAVLKHVPMGLGGVVSFCVTVPFSLPAFGLGWGVTLAYVAAFSYLLAYSSLSRWWRGRRPI